MKKAKKPRTMYIIEHYGTGEIKTICHACLIRLKNPENYEIVRYLNSQQPCAICGHSLLSDEHRVYRFKVEHRRFGESAWYCEACLLTNFFERETDEWLNLRATEYIFDPVDPIPECVHCHRTN